MNGFLPDLLEVSLTMGAVIALLLLLTPVLAKRFSPRWRYWAWLFVALRLCLPFNLTLPTAPVQVEAPPRLTAPRYDPNMTAEKEAAPVPGGLTTTKTDVLLWQQTHKVEYRDADGNLRTVHETPVFRLEGVNGDWAFSVHWEGLWALGAGLSLLHLAWCYLRMCRDLKKRRLAPSDEERKELEKQRRLQMVLPDVALYRVPGLSSPMLMGFLRPAVLLPEGLPESALPVTLAHELTHLKRHDLWYKLLLALARCLHWFNPLVWWMGRRAGQDVELCCDYDLLHCQSEDARRAYGQAILDQMKAGAAPAPRLTTGFSGDKQEVFARFRAIMDTSAKKKGRAALAFTLAAVLLAGGLVACQTEEPSSAGSEPPAGGGEVTAWLESDPDHSISANYYGDGFDWDYDVLHKLVALADTDTLVLQLPEGVTETVRAGRDFYHQVPVDDSKGGMIDRDTYDLTPDDQGRISLPLKWYADSDSQRMTFFLTWGDNAAMRYVFQVYLARSAPAFTGALGPDGAMLVYGSIDQEMTGVHYEAVDWFDEEDDASSQAWFLAHYTYGDGETLYADLAEGAQVLYRAGDGQTYPLNPATILYSIHMTTEGSVMLELTFNGEGQVTRAVMRGGVSLDLSAADLDFTGYTGTVYARTLQYLPGDQALGFDPCFEEGDDRHHTMYFAPLAVGARLPQQLTAALSPTGKYTVVPPDGYAIEMVGGAVAGVEDIWDEKSETIGQGYAVIDLEHYTGTVYAKQAYTAQVTDLETLEYAKDGVKILYLYPCEASGWDRDDSFYVLPLAEGADIPGALKGFLSGLSSARYPDLYEIEVKNGQVTAVHGRWQDWEGEPSSLEYMDLSDYTGTLYGWDAKEVSYVMGDEFLTLNGVQLPLAEGTEIPDDLMAFFSGTSSAQYPEYYEISLVNGAITDIEGIWPDETSSDNLE